MRLRWVFPPKNGHSQGYHLPLGYWLQSWFRSGAVDGSGGFPLTAVNVITHLDDSKGKRL